MLIFSKIRVTNKLFMIYGDALENAGVGVNSKDISLPAVRCEALNANIGYLNAENDLLVAKNHYQNAMLKSLVWCQDQSWSIQQRVENALQILSSEDSEAKPSWVREKRM